MYKKREFTEGVFYHVTSRTNDKIRVFENKLGRKIMLIVLQAAKDKFHFRLDNFCIMPTHIHLLIKPAKGTSLSVIMQWVKIHSAKYWNKIHGSTDHLWGARFFAKEVDDTVGYEKIMNYIDQNPVVVGLAPTPAAWKASGAYYRALNIQGLVDFKPKEPDIKLLSPIPPLVSRLLPTAQLSYTLRYYGAFAETIDRLYRTVQAIPRLGETETERQPCIYLRYYTATTDYFIYEYDTQDTMFGKVRFNIYPNTAVNRKISLSELLSNQNIKLDFSWGA